VGLYGKDNKRSSMMSARVNKIDTSELWIVPYADFMSVLMILFLIMFVFAYSSKKDKRYNELIVAIQTEMGGTVRKDVLEQMKDTEKTEQTVLKFDEMLEDQNLTKYVSVSYDTEQIKIVMKNPILFDVGQVELRKESEAVLHEMSDILKNTENDVIIEGHTDNTPVSGFGKYKSNWEISQRRAIEVVKYFVKSERINPAKFGAAGYGEFRPVFPNDTPEHKSQNRRIEINVLRGKAGLGVKPPNATGQAPALSASGTSAQTPAVSAPDASVQTSAVIAPKTLENNPTASAPDTTVHTPAK